MNPRSADAMVLPPSRVSLAVLLTFGALGVELGLVVAGDTVLAIDVTVLEWVQGLDLPGFDTVARMANVGFDTVGALAFAAIFAVAAVVLRRPGFLVQLAVVVVLRLAGQVLKPIFDSPRPGVEYQPDPALVSSSLGYPSGHAYTATIIMTMMVLLVQALPLPRWVTIGSIVVAMLLTLVGMVARVRVGAHWPTDTIGGVCFGLATVALMQLIVGVLFRRAAAPAPSRP